MVVTDLRGDIDHGQRGGANPRWFRPAIALTALLIAVFGASSIGLVSLIASGYRFSAVYFLCVFVLPLLTLGVSLTWKSRDPAQTPLAQRSA